MTEKFFFSVRSFVPGQLFTPNLLKLCTTSSALCAHWRIQCAVRLQVIYTYMFEGVVTRNALADWMRFRSAPRAVRWAMTLLPGTAEIENKAGGESAN